MEAGSGARRCGGMLQPCRMLPALPPARPCDRSSSCRPASPPQGRTSRRARRRAARPRPASAGRLVPRGQPGRACSIGCGGSLASAGAGGWFGLTPRLRPTAQGGRCRLQLRGSGWAWPRRGGASCLQCPGPTAGRAARRAGGGSGSSRRGAARDTASAAAAPGGGSCRPAQPGQPRQGGHEKRPARPMLCDVRTHKFSMNVA